MHDPDMTRRRFESPYFFFVKWTCFSLGIRVDLAGPNVELHVPFGFFRVGWNPPYTFPKLGRGRWVWVPAENE